MIKWDQSRVFGQELAALLKKENPESRAKIEIFEKVGIIEDEITPVKSTEKIKISSASMKIMSGKYFHFYLKRNKERLNWIRKISSLMY